MFRSNPRSPATAAWLRLSLLLAAGSSHWPASGAEPAPTESRLESPRSDTETAQPAKSGIATPDLVAPATTAPSPETAVAGSGAVAAPTAEALAAAPLPSPPPSTREQSVSSCTLPPDEEFFGIEWARRTSFRSVCVTAHWLDSLFGDEDFDAKAGRINGFVAFVAEKREGRSWDVVPRVRASVRLPSLSKKVDIFFDRDREDETIAGQPAVLHPIPPDGSQESSQAGIGYQLHQGEKDELNIRLGLRMRSWKPELFLRNRYQIVFADTARDRWKFDQTLFWKRGEGVGETSNLDYDNHLGGPYLLRWGNSATFSETSVGVRWQSTLTLFHALNDDRAMQWSYGFNGETRQADKLSSYGPRVSFRQRMKQRWLFFEAFLGVDYAKVEPTFIRETQRYFGVKLEAQFNPP